MVDSCMPEAESHQHARGQEDVLPMRKLENLVHYFKTEPEYLYLTPLLRFLVP